MPLHRDEFDVDARSLGQCPQVAGIGGEDVIPVSSQAYDSGVDRIGQTAAASSMPVRRPRPSSYAAMSAPGGQPGHRHLTPGDEGDDGSGQAS
jgi:hypothetical protein